MPGNIGGLRSARPTGGGAAKKRRMSSVFWNLRSKFYQNVREAHERHAFGVPFLRPSGTPRPKGALSPAVFRLCRNRQGRRTAVRRVKFSKKVGACT